MSCVNIIVIGIFCPLYQALNPDINVFELFYGSWIWAEVDSSLLFNDRGFLRRVKNIKNEFFDNFEEDANTDKTNWGEED